VDAKNRMVLGKIMTKALTVCITTLALACSPETVSWFQKHATL